MAIRASKGASLGVIGVRWISLECGCTSLTWMIHDKKKGSWALWGAVIEVKYVKKNKNEKMKNEKAKDLQGSALTSGKTRGKDEEERKRGQRGVEWVFILHS